jgi:hypothetical protein
MHLNLSGLNIQNTAFSLNSIHVILNGILQTKNPEMGNSSIHVKIIITGYIAIPWFVMQVPFLTETTEALFNSQVTIKLIQDKKNNNKPLFGYPLTFSIHFLAST